MRIIVLSQYFLPEMGAPQNRLFDLTQGLKRLGWDVRVVTALPNYPTGRIYPEYRKRFSRKEDFRGIETLRYWLYASNSARPFPRILSMLSFSMTSLFSLFYIRRTKTDFILVESPPLTLAISGWLLALLSGSRLILNVSDLWPLSAKELGAMKEGWTYRRLEKLELFLYRRAFLCTGQSQEIVDHISRLVPGKAYLFRNGVDTSRFQEVNRDPAKRKCLVYAGLLGVAQGILSICEQIDFKQLGAEFHIYGSGKEQLAIEQYLAKNPDKGISYRGTLSRDQIPDILSSYGGALIALVKNIYGAVPSKIYEAMAAGLPIIFSGEGEGASIIQQGQCGWVNPARDWSGIRENIRKFVALDERGQRELTERNRLLSRNQFDRVRELSKLHGVLMATEGQSGLKDK